MRTDRSCASCVKSRGCANESGRKIKVRNEAVTRLLSVPSAQLCRCNLAWLPLGRSEKSERLTSSDFRAAVSAQLSVPPSYSVTGPVCYRSSRVSQALREHRRNIVL
ncbi:hypothetical protein PHSY_000163 [Pseudozyma hubeiensis SY62]|uniref:Uncharacterized protein n=1 Tax=Pseudozyma hubeiensis (strain SY62) TaxID=1305764 RepID=R9NVU9_PSEHS|nr:hypothetical protein PHSY_000163 [Pseudozyma hubeiensis SY62]GAC92609.1 hypothetical protein PHSY_000163 [Pseudozyma hubeiensis SY62]